AAELAGLAERALLDQGAEPSQLDTVRRVHVRYAGTDTALGCALPSGDRDAPAVDAIRDEFERVYRQRYAFAMPGRALVLEMVSVEAIARGEPAAAAMPAPDRTSAAPPEQG